MVAQAQDWPVAARQRWIAHDVRPSRKKTRQRAAAHSEEAHEKASWLLDRAISWRRRSCKVECSRRQEKVFRRSSARREHEDVEVSTIWMKDPSSAAARGTNISVHYNRAELAFQFTRTQIPFNMRLEHLKLQILLLIQRFPDTGMVTTWFAREIAIVTGQHRRSRR